MRFRHLTDRYSEVALQVGLRPLGDLWCQSGQVVLARPEYHPPMDVYETPEALFVKLDLAGVREESLDVTLYADALVVAGVRHCRLPPGSVTYRAAGIHYGPIRVEVPIAVPVDREHATAEYERGFLEVRLPRRRGGEAR